MSRKLTTRPLNGLARLCAVGIVAVVLAPVSAFGHDAGADGLPDNEVVTHRTNWLFDLIGTAEADARIEISQSGVYRLITSDGLPDHSTGNFPNRNNPNRISSQNYSFRVPLDPQRTGRPNFRRGYMFGVALNGVPLDPGTAEFWRNDRSSGWNMEAIGGPRNLGLDRNNAHVQPTGAYHYHGIPTGILEQATGRGVPVLIGYAADGFPIYGPRGYRDPDNPASGLHELRSSYRLKSGSRPDGPGGRHDGSYTRDWEYVTGSGDLDECNGREGVTPEYQDGTYYYVVTDTFPFVPRCFMGTPDESFAKRGGPQGGRRGEGNRRPPGGGLFGPPPGHRPPPRP